MTFKELSVGTCFYFSSQAFKIENDSMKQPVLYKKVLLLNDKANSKIFKEEDHCYILNTNTGQLTTAMPSHMDELVIEVLLVIERKFTELSAGDFFFFADNPGAIGERHMVLYQKTVISDNHPNSDQFYILNNNTGEMIKASEIILEKRVARVLIK